MKRKIEIRVFLPQEIVEYIDREVELGVLGISRSEVVRELLMDLFNHPSGLLEKRFKETGWKR